MKILKPASAEEEVQLIEFPVLDFPEGLNSVLALDIGSMPSPPLASRVEKNCVDLERASSRAPPQGTLGGIGRLSFCGWIL